MLGLIFAILSNANTSIDITDMGAGREGGKYKKRNNGFLKLHGILVIMKPIICVKFGVLAVLDTSQ